MATITMNGSSCCCRRHRVAVRRRPGIRGSETGILTKGSRKQQHEQVVVSPASVSSSELLCSRLAGFPSSTPSTPPRLHLVSNRNCFEQPRIPKRNRLHKAFFILIGVCILSIICLPQAQAHSLSTSSSNLKQNLEESPPPPTTTTKSPPPEIASYTSSQENQLNLTTTSPSTSGETTCADCGQDERSSVIHDDDDAESCPGLSEDATAKTKDLSSTQRLVNLQSCLQKKIRRKLKDSTRDSMELFDKLSLSGGCSASLMSLMASLGQIKSYAFKFFDASAKIPSGVLYGLLSDFGDFDQCLSIRSDPTVTLDIESEENAFSGKYCLLDFHMNYHIELSSNETVPEGIDPDGILWDELVRNYWTSKSPKGFQIGMCFPSKCTDDDLNQLYTSLGESYNFNGRILQCQDSFDLRALHTPDLVQQSILYVFYTFIAMTIVGTFLHRYGEVWELMGLKQVSCYGAIHDILTCFSLGRSWTIFTSLSTLKQVDNTCPMKTCSSSSTTLDNNQSLQHEPTDDEKGISNGSTGKSCLSHLSGLRLFVILWITMGHSFLYPSASNYQHYRSIINMNLTRDSVWFATTNFTLGIDMLLYMTGLVFVFKFGSLTVDLASEKRSSTKINSISPSGSTSKIWCLLVEKIFRFWPTYFAVIALAIIVPLCGDGPMWPEMITRRIGESCRKNWWTNLLFINNFQKESEICLPSSWFVSVLMQLFLVGSLILLIEQKYSTKAAMATLFGLLVSSCVYSFGYAFHFKVNAPVIRMDESFVMEMDEDIWRLYTNIFNNLGPFLIGMVGGYQLLRFKHATSSSSKPVQTLLLKSSISGWLVELACGCLFVGLAALVLSSVFYQNYSPLASSVYWSFHRIGWALFTGYVVHKCATGSWTLLKDFLSLSSFIPISRLIFVAYLVYPIFIHMHSGLVRDGLHVSIYNMFNVYITRLVLTFSTSLIIHLLFEIPLHLLEELLYRKFSDSSPDATKPRTPAPTKKAQGERRKSSTAGVLLNTLPDNAASMENV